MPSQFSKILPTKPVVSLMLSGLVAVSAIGFAGPLTPHQVSATKTKTSAPEKPADKKDAPKSAGDKASKDKESKEAKASPAEIDASIASAQRIDSLDLLKNPPQYMNKKVTFTATFNRFADIALDYKKAFRDSRDYVTFFVLRPDVKEHTIPMAELKLFFPRKKSDEVMDLESGDKIQVVGTEFATALDEPWVDIEHIKILEKTAHPDKKHEAPEF